MIRLTLALWMDEVHQVSAEQATTAWRETSSTEALRDHRKGSKPPPPLLRLPPCTSWLVSKHTVSLRSVTF